MNTFIKRHSLKVSHKILITFIYKTITFIKCWFSSKFEHIFAQAAVGMIKSFGRLVYQINVVFVIDSRNCFQ